MKKTVSARKLITTTEAAEILHCSSRTIRRKCENGRIKATKKHGQGYLIEAESLLLGRETIKPPVMSRANETITELENAAKARGYHISVSISVKNVGAPPKVDVDVRSIS